MFYSEPRHRQPLRIISAASTGIMFVFLLGYIYTLFSIYMPFVYFKFIITAGLGFAIGYLTRFLAFAFKITGVQNKILLGVLLSFFTYYFHWIAYILFLMWEKYPDLKTFFSNAGMITRPMFFQIIYNFYSHGAWTLFGIPFKGLALGIVWLIEAFLVFALPVKIILEDKPKPFSFNTNLWYPVYSLSEKFKLNLSKPQLLKQLKENPLTAIEKLGKGSHFDNLNIYLYYLEEEQQQYISFINNRYDKKGNLKTQFIIENFKIDKQTAQKILQKYPYKKNKLRFI